MPILFNVFADDLEHELDHSDSNEDDSQEISLEVEENLLKDEPEC